MANTGHNPNTNYRWYITFGFTIVFVLIGFAIGWSTETQHPDDRLADILFPTSLFLTAGFLVGYFTSLVMCRRFRWIDAVAGYAILPLCFVGFYLTKSGERFAGGLFGYSALGLILFLVVRFALTARRYQA